MILWKRRNISLIVLLVLVGCAGLSRPGEQLAQASKRSELAEIEVLLGAGKIDRARQRLEDFLADDPENVALHRRLQNLRLELKEDNALYREYGLLVQEHPAAGGYHYLLGRLLHRQDDQRLAFERAREVSPQLVWGHYGLAWLAATSADVTMARRHLEDALACDPGHSLSRALLARVLLLQQQAEEARLVLLQLLKDEPELYEGWSLLASAAQMLNNYDLELEARARLLSLDWRAEDNRDRLVDLATRRDSPALNFLASDLLKREFAKSGVSRDTGWQLAMAGLLAAEGRFGEARGLAQSVAKAGRRDMNLRPLLELGDDWLTERLAYYELSFDEVAEPLQVLLKETPDRGELSSWLGYAEHLLNAGFVVRSAAELKRIETQFPGDEAVGAFAARLRGHRRLEARLQLLADQLPSDAAGSLQNDLSAFLFHVAQLIEEETGYKASSGNRELAVPLVGEALDSTLSISGSINGYFRRSNQILYAGRLAGGRVQALLMTTLSGPKEVLPFGWSPKRPCQEVVGALSVMRPRDEFFGDSGGRAIFGGYYLDLDILIPGKARLSSVSSLPLPIQSMILADEGLPATNDRELRDLSRPGTEAEALLLTAIKIQGQLPFVEQVRVHEQGHLVDSLRYLPIFNNLLPNLALVFRNSFSATSVMADLEAAAQLYSLCHGPSPHLALAEMVRLIPRAAVAGPHSKGYEGVLQAFINQLARDMDRFPQLRSDRCLLHQLHHLTEAEIRSVANKL